jgi:hypothetical protein
MYMLRRPVTGVTGSDGAVVAEIAPARPYTVPSAGIPPLQQHPAAGLAG